MTNLDLKNCKLITNEQYLLLDNPTFVGQTKVDNNLMYYMVFEHNGVYYKTYNML